MSSTPFVQLLWKEYRAARAFWLSLIVLVIAAQGLTFWLSDDADYNVKMVWNLALAAPAFFALGCAGAAFAVEQEEGTFDFLQAAPVSPRQVFTSKLLLAAAATLAMFLLLWPLALVVTGGELPAAKTLSGMLGLWILAAVEALAWGTLFSLLSARPLVAICLALVTTSTIVHLSAWSTLAPGEHDFSFAPYLHAVPLRALIVAAVLAADVYVGLQWLRGGALRARRAKPKMRDVETHGPIHASADSSAVKALVARPDRGAMLTHLLWHHWRQSGWLMLLMAGVQIGLVLLVLVSGVYPAGISAAMPMVAIAGLAGSCVFLADQERRHYRYFVEHNVPPRLVWVARQLPWIGTLCLSTSIAFIAWIGPRVLVALSRLVESATNIENYWGWNWRQPDYIDLPQVLFGLACVAVAYAAGQWASMMVRSGLLAGFFGLLLAGVLCGWVYLMLLLQVNWLWTVVPIPFVLLWATWLRAPDWIRENTTWAARLRAGAAVLVPALVLLIAVPVYRVRSVPFVAPNFDLAAYQAGVNPAALGTAELYRRANELYVPAEKSIQYGERGPIPARVKWLEENAESLALLLEASRRPTCCLADPARMNYRPSVRNETGLIRLIIISGRQMQAEGKLDEALDRYFAAFRVISQWTEHMPFEAYWDLVREAKWVFSELVDWSAASGQTAQRVRAGVERLGGVDWRILHLEDGLKSQYILARRYVEGDDGAGEALFDSKGSGAIVATRLFWDRLLPWEKYRELRRLNGATRQALVHLTALEQLLRDGQGIGEERARPHSYWNEFPPFFAAGTMNESANDLASKLALFEANRRAALLRMALVAYRIEHGELPATLNNLVQDGYFEQLPRDPYSGLDYLYFPEGFPEPQTALELAEADEARNPIIFGEPCVWCTSDRLDVRTVEHSTDDDNPSAPTRSYVYYVGNSRYEPPFRLPTYVAWSRGQWYPIPMQQK
jgi:hypothetical protein